jgi:hypothetical protein
MCPALCPKRHNRLTLILLTLILLTLTARGTQTNQIMPATLLTSLQEASAQRRRGSNPATLLTSLREASAQRSDEAIQSLF